MSLIIATSNLGKLAEFQELLPGRALVALPKDFVLPEETGTTYEANARLKAESAARAFNAPALGDDSGLEVDALGGRPGLYSARFAKERLPGEAQDAANRRQLLTELQASGVAESEWRARFVCVLAYAVPGKPTRVFHGEAHGRVLPHERGSKGFGYDPLLLLEDLDRTFAEIDGVEKNRLSHRGQATRLFIAQCL